MQKKKKAAQLIHEELSKNNHATDPIQEAQLSDQEYIDSLKWCVQHMLKQVDCSHLIGTNAGHEKCETREAATGDFYVRVETRHEQKLGRAFKNMFVGVFACPTPNYDQSVFKYHYKDEYLEYLWTIPCREACFFIKENANRITPEHHQLMNFVMDFDNGNLLLEARRRNGENLKTGIVLEGN